jgi:ureidoglycolate hydrolase
LSIDNGLYAAAMTLVNNIRSEPVEVKLLIAAFQALPMGLANFVPFSYRLFFYKVCLQTGYNPECPKGPAFTP